MNKPKPAPKIEYIPVQDKDANKKLALAFGILFEAVMRDRKAKQQLKNRHEIPSIQI